MKHCPECRAAYPEGVRYCYRDGERLLDDGDGRDPLVGVLLDGRFRLAGRLGTGGMGTVYRGTQEPVGRPVAIKVLRPDLAADKDAVRRFFH
jgi:serine/threonine protein kinase